MPARGRLPDILVMVATPLVAAALAMALNLQMGVRLVESVAIAGLLAVGLLLGHALMKREQAIAEMRREMNRLSAAMQAYGRPPMSGPRPMMAGRPMPPPLRPMAPGLDGGAPMAPQAQMPPQGAMPPPRDARAPIIVPPPVSPAATGQTSVAPEAGVAPPLTPVDRITAALNDAGRAADTAASNDAADAPAADADEQTRVAMPDLAEHFNVRAKAATPVHEGAADPAADPRATAVVDVSTEQPMPLSGILPPLENPTRLSTSGDDAVAEADDGETAPSAGQDLRDLEMMQNLVEQLANQLGSGRAKPHVAPEEHADTPAPGPIEMAVAASVDALRTTSEAMREAIEPSAADAPVSHTAPATADLRLGKRGIRALPR
ncbi:MAG: hypothetical protein R3D68_13140 [Hyphomicrobiaceae bacterium]